MRAFVVAGLTAVMLAACGPNPGAAACQKKSSCNALEGESESTCESDSSCVTAGLRKAGGNCNKLADDYDAIASCESKLACSDFVNGVVMGCDSQFAALSSDMGAVDLLAPEGVDCWSTAGSCPGQEHL